MQQTHPYIQFNAVEFVPFEGYTINESSPNGPDDLLWGVDLLGETDPAAGIDPNRPDADRNVEFDAPGFDVSFGTSGTSAIDLHNIDTITRRTLQWSDWRDSAGRPGYFGAAAGSWSDWEERMWYLLNLTRIGLFNRTIADAPLDRGFDTIDFLSDDLEADLRLPVRVD